jgi:hypothetical protein
MEDALGRSQRSGRRSHRSTRIRNVTVDDLEAAGPDIHLSDEEMADLA